MLVTAVLIYAGYKRWSWQWPIALWAIKLIFVVGHTHQLAANYAFMYATSLSNMPLADYALVLGTIFAEVTAVCVAAYATGWGASWLIAALGRSRAGAASPAPAEAVRGPEHS